MTAELQALNERIDRIEKLTVIGAKSVLDIHEAALFLGYSESYLYFLTSTKQIPHYKKFRKIMFKKAEIEEWLLDHRVKTEKEISIEATTYISTHKK